MIRAESAPKPQGLKLQDQNYLAKTRIVCSTAGASLAGASLASAAGSHMTRVWSAFHSKMYSFGALDDLETKHCLESWPASTIYWKSPAVHKLEESWNPDVLIIDFSKISESIERILG